MRNDLRSSIVWLGPDQLLELRDAQGRVLTTVIGTLWMTQEGDPRDAVIGPGDSRRIERDGVTLAQTLDGAAYVLIEDGVDARVIHADGTSEVVSRAAPATTTDVADPARLDSVQLHALARIERSRGIAAAFVDSTDAMLRAVRAAGRRLATLATSATAPLAR